MKKLFFASAYGVEVKGKISWGDGREHDYKGRIDFYVIDDKSKR